MLMGISKRKKKMKLTHKKIEEIVNDKEWNYEKNLEQNTESICYTQC